MRLLTCVLVALMLIVGTAFAAAPVHTDKGDKAMVFTFHGLDELGLDGFWDGYGIGLRYYISDMNAIRAGIEFENQSWTDKGLGEDEEDYENSESSIGFTATYERHLEAPCASVSPYLGAGLGYWRWKTEDEMWDLRANPKYIEEESGFDVHAVAGFEWGFTECMTLGGEYQLGWYSGSWTQEYDNGSGDTTTTDEEEYSWMGFDTVSLFLSVYW